MRISPGAYIIFVLVLLAAIPNGYAQRKEISVHAYSGFFSFRGNGATTQSHVNAFIPAVPGTFTGNPYGKTSGISYAFEIQGQQVFKEKYIYGLGIGFESLESKVKITELGGGDLVSFRYPSHGKTTLRNTFVTINPFVGHRYATKKSSFDLTAGVDIALCLRSTEKGRAATMTEEDIVFENGLAKPAVDMRPRIQIKVHQKRFGFIAGYSLGLTNFHNRDDMKAYTSFVRLGLSYQLK